MHRPIALDIVVKFSGISYSTYGICVTIIIAYWLTDIQYFLIFVLDILGLALTLKQILMWYKFIVESGLRSIAVLQFD